MNPMFCTLTKYIFLYIYIYIKEFSRHGGFKATSKPQSIITTSVSPKRSPRELRWILIMIAAHTQKNPCEVKKKKEPPRDLQFPQSPVNLNISTKRSSSQGQRRHLYLHKSWRGVITRKKKTQMPISVTQPQCVSTFFFPVFFSESHPSDFFSSLCLFFF